MVKEQEKAAKQKTQRNERLMGLLVIGGLLAYVCCGAAVMAHYEGWPYLHALHFSMWM